MAIQSFLHENERVYESPLAFDKQPTHRISSHRGEIKGRSNLKLVHNGISSANRCSRPIDFRTLRLPPGAHAGHQGSALGFSDLARGRLRTRSLEVHELP